MHSIRFEKAFLSRQHCDRRTNVDSTTSSKLGEGKKNCPNTDSGKAMFFTEAKVEGTEAKGAAPKYLAQRPSGNLRKVRLFWPVDTNGTLLLSLLILTNNLLEVQRCADLQYDQGLTEDKFVRSLLLPKH